MKLQKNDVRLLQFVLNEISNIDRDIVLQSIQNQPEIAHEVASLRKQVGELAVELTQPNNLQMTAEQKQSLFAQTIYSKSNAQKKIGFIRRWQWLIGGLTAVAFTVLVFNKSMYKQAQTLHNSDEFIFTPSASPEAGSELKRKIKDAPAKALRAEPKDDVELQIKTNEPKMADYKESEIRPQPIQKPARVVAIPTHASESAAALSLPEPIKKNEFRRQRRLQFKVEITSSGGDDLKVEDPQKQLIFQAAQACLGAEFDQARLISINYFLLDKKISVFLTSGPTTRPVSSLGQQQCLSSEIEKLPWGNVPQIKILITNESD
jgi:hypothetical protein